jgi:hypothetical protein
MIGNHSDLPCFYDQEEMSAGTSARTSALGKKKKRVNPSLWVNPGLLWCRSRDLNPDGFCPLPPQDSVSTRFHHFGIPVCPGLVALRHPVDAAGNLPVSNGFVNIKSVAVPQPAPRSISPTAEQPETGAPGQQPGRAALRDSAREPFSARPAWRPLPSESCSSERPYRTNSKRSA